MVEGELTGARDDRLDEQNAAFWNELCGSGLAREIGIVDYTPAELARFDSAYMHLYPYLDGYLDALAPAGKRVLEIGTGFGTIGRRLLRRGAEYHAIDIAPAPIAMARSSLRAAGQSPDQAKVASALQLPHADETFDALIAIGSLHHTGALEDAVREAIRVVRQGGQLLVMVYNSRSPNRVVTTPIARTLARLMPRRRDWLLSRTEFDHNAAGAVAPATEFASSAALRGMFRGCRHVRVDKQNANAVTIHGRTLVPRSLLLPTLGRVVGLDLYALVNR